MIAMYTGNDYPSKDDLEKSISLHYDTPDQYHEFLDYLSQPHWFEKVLIEMKKGHEDDGNHHRTDTSES